MAFIEFLPNKKFPKQGADIADTPDAFTDAGYCIEEKDLIIDVDNIEKPIIEKIITMFNIKTQIVWTNRGAHFYYRKPQGFKGNKKVCPLGFEVEYKHLGNSKYITVKQDGKLRIVENEGIREDLPSFFFTRKKLDSLLGIDEAEGRNSALFAHRMKIYEIDLWQSILRFINNNIFAKALPEEEFQTISREVKIEAKANGEADAATDLLNKYKFVLYGGRLFWLLQNGEYTSDKDHLVRFIFEEVGLKKMRYVDEVIKQLVSRAPLISPNKVFHIKLQNGILKDGLFSEVDSKEFTPYSISLPYNPQAETVETVDNYLNHLTNNDADYKQRLLEILAHPLVVDKDFKRMLAKFFIFIGDGGNGKGTLLQIIQRILGHKNCSALSIKNMTDERYFTTMQGKLVNLGDDVQDEAINREQMKIIKNISTCDRVATRNLFEQSKDVELTTSLIFTSNHVLKSFEKGESYKRRVDWLPMYGKPAVKDHLFIQKLTTPAALEYWMKIIVEAYLRLYKNRKFTESKIVTQFNEKYHKENNTALEYLMDFTEKDFINLRSPEAYDQYEIWAEENGVSVQSRKLFVQSLYDTFGLTLQPKKINGKTARVFGKSEE